MDDLRALHACTIITPDHLPPARVLARSFAEHHPGGRFTALVVGDIPAGDEPFEVLGLNALDCPPLAAMVTGFETLGLMCALKPWLLLRLLEASESVLFLDADVRFYGPVDDAFAAARRHGLVLTRHLLGLLPRDGRHPSEEDILAAGAFNAGFVGAGRAGRPFVRSWAERTAEDCRIDLARGHFYDQRWLELAPHAHVLTDPGVNCGFWDLPNRPLSGGPGTYAAAGAPLRCFHFSGFDPFRPDLLSVHQDRVHASEHPVLARLLRDYADELLAAGHADALALRPVEQTPLMRQLAREGRATGELRAPLGSRAAEQELEAWLLEPALRGGWAGITRYLLALHAALPELPRRFRDLDGPDAVRYADWVREHLCLHPELPERMAPRPVTVGGRELGHEPLLRDLFATRGAPLPEFLAWLAGPAPEGADAGATRYLYELRRARDDLREAFPAVGPELVAWARAHGAREHPLVGELLYASSERAGAGSFE